MPSLSEAGRGLRDELDVEPTPVADLSRRRVRAVRRRGVVASIAVAAIVSGLIIAIQSNPASQHVVVPAAPGVSVTTAAGQQASRSGCTLADLNRPRPTAMPTPTALTSPKPIGGGETVGPPAAGLSTNSAAISPQEVWSHDYLDAIPDVQILPQAGGGVNEMYLGSFYNTAVGKDRLVWLLERNGVAMNPVGGGIVDAPATATTMPAVQSVCGFYTLIVVVDATTGQPLQEGVELESTPSTKNGSPSITTPATTAIPTETTPSQLWADLPAGYYTDGRDGTPHYVLTYATSAVSARILGGTLFFLYQDGKTATSFSYVASTKSDGSMTLTTNTGATHLGKYSSHTITLTNCGSYLPWANANNPSGTPPQSCTFTYNGQNP